MKLDNFFAELKRRNVYKVAVAYGIVAWVLIQVSDTVFPRLNLPDRAVTLVIVLLILGFPVALVVAWAFELTPEGIKRTEDIAPSESITRRTGRKATALIVIAAFVAAALFAWQYYQSNAISVAGVTASPTAIADMSIAVLPFENASGNPETEYLSDGISEALINSLTELQQLKVVARSTAFRYKNREIDPQEVGRVLKVRTVLMGAVRQMAERMHVQVDLVDAITGAQLWGEKYERNVTDTVNIKQAIAREVTNVLRVKLSGEEKQKLVREDTANPEAYQSYLQGLFHWNRRTTESLKQAEARFQDAIRKDPGYARAYAALAQTYAIFPSYSAGSPIESYSKAKAAAQRALELDPTLVEAYVALAGAVLDLDWNLQESNRLFERAIELNPHYPTAHHWYGEINLLASKEPEKAIAHLKKAQELDPLSPIINADLGEVYINARQYDKATEQLQRTVAMEPNFHVARMNLGIAYTFEGRHEEAVREFLRARQLSEDPRVLARLGYVYGLMGRKAEALALLSDLSAKATEQYVSRFRFAHIYIGLGEADKAFTELEAGYQDHSPECEYLTYEPIYDSIRDDPRFVALVKKIGF